MCQTVVFLSSGELDTDRHVAGETCPECQKNKTLINILLNPLQYEDILRWIKLSGISTKQILKVWPRA